MEPAPEGLRASTAVRPSISARPRAAARRGPACAARAAALALGCALAGTALPALAQATRPVDPPGQIGAPEPLRPTMSVPYDGAVAAYRAGRADEALALAERALEASPRDPQLRFLRATLLAEKQRTDEALQAFGALVQDFPELPEPYNNLAVLHAQRGEWDRAREALEQSIRAVPTYALAHENLGDIHLQLAARSYERAAKLDARAASPRGKLAMARELIARVAAPPTEPRNPRPAAQPEVNSR